MPLYIHGGDKIIKAVLGYEELSMGHKAELVSSVWSDGGDDHVVLMLVYKMTSDGPIGRQSTQTRCAVYLDPTDASKPVWSSIINFVRGERIDG